MSKILSGLKIKGINDYLNKKKIIFNTYVELVESSNESITEILLSERDNLLATYLLVNGLKNATDIMKELNYTNFNEFSKDLADILSNKIAKDRFEVKKLQDKQILTSIVGNIISNYILNDDNSDKIYSILIVEEEEEVRFLSFNKLKPIIIEQMTKFNFFEDIHLIIENVIIEFRKIDALEFIDREAIEKYEIYYKLKEDIEIKEILYKL
jgi:hypothetical protein